MRANCGILLIVLNCLCFSLHSNTNLDSLKNELSNAQQKDKSELAYKIVREYKLLNQDSAKKYILFALKNIGSKDLALKAKLLHAKARCEREKNNYSTFFQDLKKSQKIAEQIGDSNLIFLSKLNYGDGLLMKGKQVEGLNYIDSAFAIAKALNDSTKIGICYNEYAIASGDILDNEKAKSNLRKAIGYTKSKIYKTWYLNGLGVIFGNEAKHDSSAHYYRIALERAIALGDSLLTKQIRMNLYQQLVFLDFEQHRKGFMKSLEELEKNGSFLQAMGSYNTLANYFVEHKKSYHEGIKYCNLGLALGAKHNIDRFEIPLKENKCNAFIALNMKDSAIHLMKHLTHLRYDVFQKDVSSKMGNLERDLLASEKEIAEKSSELAKKELSLANEREKTARIRNIILLVTGVLGILILVLVFASYRLKAKNKMLSMEQNLLRLQMNPHFIFNALNSIQGMIGQNDTNRATKYVGKFGKLLRGVLELSRKEVVSLEEEIESVEDYLSFHKLRNNIDFEYRVEIDDAIDPYELEVPPMLFQPFLENALEHGMPENEQGVITFQIKKGEKSFVHVIIEDNGPGMKQSLKNKTNDGHNSLATKITNERIDNWNKRMKSSISLAIEDLAEKGHSGTQVKFVLKF